MHGWNQFVPSGLEAGGHFDAVHRLAGHPFNVPLNPPRKIAFALAMLSKIRDDLRSGRETRIAFLRSR
eukprot:7227014-Heterocapsa_arctica.AAC.1